MRGDAEAPVHVPTMRALLFTDLCDSTLLVERLGDSAAAALFQRHDRLVLLLQRRWRGQQIDRSDGLFLLFDRAVDALGFALDYQQGLRGSDELHDVRLLARAGLHVGEVILWKNSAEAIAHGAKPVEVEGLAKPMAARLMQLARPGQILLSAAAESMVRRATDELGDTGKGLGWSSFGRWRFKGVAQPVDVFGVYAPSMPATRRPRPTPKATRDVPFWRRPLAMVAEVAIAAAVMAGIWFMTRPQPAIAFAERDWLVLADVRNLTGNVLLDDSIDQAIRISLGQSRYVNILGDLKVRDTMGRMRLPPDSVLDRNVASEVAQRDGARAVVAPTVMEVDGKLRVTVDVIDPETAATVYTVRADGRGMDSLLATTDNAVALLRNTLGEAVQDLDRNSFPLPRVATSSLDALHAFAAGNKALEQRRSDDALRFFAQAVNVDPEFAMAHIAMMRIHWMRGENDLALDAYRRADGLRARMTPRDALYLDGWSAETGDQPAAQVAQSWKLLTDLYPDYHAGYVNRARALAHVGRYADALATLQHALVPQMAARSHAYDFSGRMKLATGDIGGARSDFRTAAEIGGWKTGPNMAMASAVEENWAEADQNIREAEVADFGGKMQLAAVLIDLQRLDEAGAVARTLETECPEPGLCRVATAWALSIARMGGDRLDAARGAQLIDAALADIEPRQGSDLGTRQFMALGLIYLMQRGGMDVTRQIQSARKMIDEKADIRPRQLLDIIEATTMIHAGQGEKAVLRLSRWIDGTEMFQLHVALRDAYQASGKSDASSAEEQWLESNRGRAYIEDAGNFILQAQNVRDGRHRAAIGS